MARFYDLHNWNPHIKSDTLAKTEFLVFSRFGLVFRTHVRTTFIASFGPFLAIYGCLLALYDYVKIILVKPTILQTKSLCHLY